jgi:peptide/nickel transport system substrate-binding protein
MRPLAFACLALLLWANTGFAEPKGIFRHAHGIGSGALSNLDPINKGQVPEITEKIMSRLIRPGLDGRPQPDLATAWEANENGTIWSLTLRPGVTFHDGSSFDANDVAYSLNRVLDPKAASPARSVIKMIRKIEVTGPLSLRLVLESTFADLPLQLMDKRLRIIPEGSGDTIAHTGIGTGPFKVEKFDADGISILTANKDYYAGPPGLSRIEVIGISDSQARLQAFLGGQLDMERGIKPLLRDVLRRNHRYTVQDIPTGNWIGIAFRTDIPPFDDVRVRKAIRLAVDREDLLKLALGGGGIVSCDTPVAPNDQYRANMSCPQDIPQAKALLAEAGYEDGIDFDLYISTYDESWPAMAVAFQQQVAAAGIRVQVKKVSSDGYWSEVWMKKPVVATRWGERPADQALNEAFYSSAKWNETHFKDPVFDHMLERARLELDFEERRKYYIHAQEYLFEHSGTLIPYHITQLVGLSARVHNLDPVSNDAVRWYLVTVDD